MSFSASCTDTLGKKYKSDLRIKGKFMRVIFTLRQHSVWKSVGLCRKRWLQFTPGLADWPDMVEASDDTGTMS